VVLVVAADQVEVVAREPTLISMVTTVVKVEWVVTAAPVRTSCPSLVEEPVVI
jgi:hypothetical protein